MPRFPIVPQRSRAPAAFSNSPRAEAADFGGGLGKAIAGFGAEAAELAQVVKQRQELAERQAAREAKRTRDEAEAETLAEEAAEPEAAGDIERRQQSFEKKAEVLRQNYKDHPLEDQVKEQLALQGEAWTRKQVSGEAGRRAKADLARADEISGRWLDRVTQDPAQFDEAVANLLGEDGPVKGLGLRPEVQADWESQAFEALLSVQMQGDPGRLISDLEAGRWAERLSKEQPENWLEDARDAASLRDRKQTSERRQRIADEVMALQRSIASGEAGLAQVRRAEREGRFSPEQIEGLKREAEQEEVRAQILQAAQDEYEIALISGTGFDPENEAHRQVAEDFYVTTFREALQAGADEATQERFADVVTRTGYVTKGLAQDLTAALSSEDPEKRVAAAQLYGRLLKAAPELLPQALEPEARAHGGVLHRWLDAGLDPAEALARADRDMPPGGGKRIGDAETLAALERDAGRVFGERAGAFVARSLLAGLEEKYLDLLGQGLSAQSAQTEIQKVLGKGALRLAQFEARFADAGFVWTTQNGQRVPVAIEPRLEKAAEPMTTTIAIGVLLVGAALIWGMETSRDGGINLGDSTEGLFDWVQELSWDAKVQLFSMRPEAAPWFGLSMVTVPRQGEHLGEITHDADRGVRFVEIFDRETFGRMSVLQRWDPETQSFAGESGRYYDTDLKRWVLLDLKTGRVVPPEEEWRYRSPPLERPAALDVRPGGYGEGLEPQRPLTTGGAQPDNRPMTDQPEGQVHPERPGELITGVPDQSGIVGGPLIVLSKKHEAMGQTGYEVNPSTWYPDWPELRDAVPMIPKEWRAKPNKKANQKGKEPKPGVRWRDPSYKGNGVRVDKGDPNSRNPSQRVDHVRVDYGGKAIGPDGQAIEGSVADFPEAHIPLSAYLKWRTWYAP